MPSRSSALSRFACVYRLELRLLARSWLYFLLHGLWAALLIWMFFQRDDRTAQALLETMPGRVAIGLISLVGLFLAGISASRSQRMKIDELEDSYPTHFEVLAGRWLACVTVLLGFLAEPVALAAYQGPLASLLAELPVFMGEAALTIAFTVAVTWWLTCWLKLGRWAYPLLAGAWLAFMLGPTILSQRTSYAHLLNFMRQGTSYYSELWKRIIYGELPVWFNLFYLGMLLLFLGMLAWRYHHKRFNRPSYPIGYLVLAALALAGFSGGKYISTVQAGENQMRTHSANLVSLPSPGSAEIARVERYDLELDLSQPNTPRFQAEVHVRNTGAQALETLDFRLHYTLQVAEASLPFERDGELLRFAPPEALQPGQELILRLSYAGPVLRMDREEGLPVMGDFIRPDGIRLTPGVAWYPLIGSAQPIPLLEHPPVQIHLKVSGNERLKLAANLPSVGEREFVSQDATWVFLVGSPELVYEQNGTNTLVTARNDLKRARQLVSIYAEPYAFLKKFFPEVSKPDLLVFILGEESGLPRNTPPSDGRAVVVISRWLLAGLDRYDSYKFPQVGYPLFADLWRLSGGSLVIDPNGPVSGQATLIEAAARFAWTLSEKNGDVQAAREYFSRPEGPGLPPVEESIHLTLLDVYQSQGEAGITRLMGLIQERSGELQDLETPQLIHWIQEAAREP